MTTHLSHADIGGVNQSDQREPLLNGQRDNEDQSTPINYFEQKDSDGRRSTDITQQMQFKAGKAKTDGHNEQTDYIKTPLLTGSQPELLGYTDLEKSGVKNTDHIHAQQQDLTTKEKMKQLAFLLFFVIVFYSFLSALAYLIFPQNGIPLI